MMTDHQKRLLDTLSSCSERYRSRHEDLNWADVLARLKANADKLNSLDRIERSGGEPDVAGCNEPYGEFIFVDCSDESPRDRRSAWYDLAAMESRKEHRPENSVHEMAASMGIELLTEAE